MTNPHLEGLIPEWRATMIRAAGALEYAAFNIDGSLLANLAKGITDSTSPSTSALISARDLYALAALPGGGVEYEYEVWQGDAWQAGGSTTTLESAQSEAGHYALMYGQDGPVEVKYFERRNLTLPTPHPHEADRNG